MFIFSFFLLPTTQLSAQASSERFLEIRGISELEMKPLARATAILYEGSSKIKTLQTGPDGRFSFRLEINKQYTIHIEKEGLVSKCISFNTTMPDEENGMWLSEFSIGLFKPCQGLDYSLLKQPVDRVSFDAKRREYVSDREYVSSMRPKLEALMVKTEQCILQTYEDLVKKGDAAAKQNNFQEAIESYQEALKIYPSENYPSKRIAELNQVMRKQQMSDEMYKGLIAEADALAGEGKLSEAIQKYEKAGNLNPAVTYPKQKISELKSVVEKQNAERLAKQLRDDKYNQAMAKASVAYTRKEYSQAKQYYQEALEIKPEESLPKARLEEIRAIETKKAAEEAARAEEMAKKAAFEKEYLGIVAQADQLFKEKKYDEAKVQYVRAMNMKPGETYPAQRVKVIENAITLEQAEQKKAEQEQALSRQYNELVSVGDKQFAGKDYTNARNTFAGILQVKPGDPYALEKIKTIDQLLLAEQEARNKKVENDYAEAMRHGNSLLNAKDYTAAMQAYQKALTIKPGDNNAKLKISEVNLLIKQEQDKLSAEQARKKKYDDAIASADQYFNQKNYALAKTYYEQALTIQPGESWPRQKLNEAVKAIEDEERLLNEKRARDNAYNIAIANADKYLKAKDYYQARDEYMRASSLKPEEAFPKSKITEVESLIAQREKEIADAKARADGYTAAMNDANAAFAAKNYANARESYSQALTYMPGDVLATEQIKKIDYLVAEAEKMRRNEEAKKTAFDELIKSADGLFDQARYNDAKTEYKKALALYPTNAWAKQRIARIYEINRLLTQNPVKTQQSVQAPPKNIAAIPMRDLNFKNESEKQNYLNELVKKYPPGVTLEKYIEKYKETYRYIVIRNNEAQEFRHIRFTSYNGNQYSVNGKPITQLYFTTQTRVRDGETFKEILMQ